MKVLWIVLCVLLRVLHHPLFFSTLPQGILVHATLWMQHIREEGYYRTAFAIHGGPTQGPTYLNSLIRAASKFDIEWVWSGVRRGGGDSLPFVALSLSAGSNGKQQAAGKKSPRTERQSHAMAARKCNHHISFRLPYTFVHKVERMWKQLCADYWMTRNLRGSKNFTTVQYGGKLIRDENVASKYRRWICSTCMYSTTSNNKEVR